MKKTNNRSSNVLLAGILFFILTGCGNAIPDAAPTPDWKPLPTFSRDVFPSNSSNLRHYVPSQDLNFPLEFDYPSDWWLHEYVDEIGLPIVSLADRLFLALDTPAPPDFHPTPNDFGSISIWTLPTEAGQTPESELESHKLAYSQTSWMTVLGDYKVMIDGHDAAVLEYEINDQENYSSPMFARRIYFVVNAQLYEIFFDVAQKDRGGDFEKGYEQFFKSLNIVE